MIAAVWKGIDRPIRTPRPALIFSIAIWFDCAISRSVASIFPSIRRSARDTAWREMPNRSAIPMLGIPLLCIAQNPNCLSFVVRNTSQHCNVDNIYFWNSSYCTYRGEVTCPAPPPLGFVPPHRKGLAAFFTGAFSSVCFAGQKLQMEKNTSFSLSRIRQ